jgi:hypothetical protein
MKITLPINPVISNGYAHTTQSITGGTQDNISFTTADAIGQLIVVTSTIQRVGSQVTHTQRVQVSAYDFNQHKIVQRSDETKTTVGVISAKDSQGRTPVKINNNVTYLIKPPNPNPLPGGTTEVASMNTVLGKKGLLV